MDLFRKAFVFLLIGFASSQQDFGDLNAQIESQLNRLNNGQRFNGFNGNSNGLNFGSDHKFVRQAENPQVEFEQALAKLQPEIEKIQKQCEEAGKQDISNSLERKYPQTINCVRNRINLNQLQQEFVTAARTQTLSQLYQKLCNIWPDIHGCINPLVLDIQQCINKEDQISVNQSLGLLDESNTFWCENGQKRMVDFTKENGFQCVAESGEKIKNCAEKIIQEQKTKVNKDKLSVSFDAEDCADFKKVRSCIYYDFTCASSTPGKIIDDYLALTQRVICNSASSLAWFSTFNVLLVLCTFFYTKMF